MKTIRPSSSYELQVPDDAVEEVDERVISVWRADEQLLLQLSSFVRESGEQISAEKRLADRMVKEKQEWEIVSIVSRPSGNVDVAGGQTKGPNGTIWYHIYLTWPHFTIYSTISGPGNELSSEERWPFLALRSIKLVSDFR